MLSFKNSSFHYFIVSQKYKFLSLFTGNRKAIVNFKSIKEISFEKKITLEGSSNGLSFRPKTALNTEQNIAVTFDECAAYFLKKHNIHSQSTSLFSKRENTIYYDKFPDDSDFSYQSAIIKKHNSTKANIELLNDDISIQSGVFLGGTFIWNYYHFLIEIVSKAYYLEQLPNDIKKLPILFDVCVEEIPTFKEIIQLFFKNYTIQILDSKKSYTVENLWYITYPNTSPFNIANNKKYKASYTKTRPQTIDYIRKKVLENLNATKISIQPIDKIFISRKSKIRTYNQDEIVAAAKKYGFEEVFFEDLSFFEQVFIMQNANVVIGATGAAWTNVIFAKEKAKGLIWMSDIWGDLSVFSNLAKMINFDLNYYIYENNSTNFHSEYYLDPHLFEQKINYLLA